jgi:hypothetical protein
VLPSISTAWKRNGRHEDAMTTSALTSGVVKMRARPVSTLVAARKSLVILQVRRRSKSTVCTSACGTDSS